MDAVLTLIKETPYKDENGVQRVTQTSRNVFCDKKSITRSEFFNAGRNGLNPEMMFKVFRGDYDGERKCEFEGKKLAIYRTYIGDGDYIEIYAQREGGTNG